jgi:AcrR family transcriptional regulator
VLVDFFVFSNLQTRHQTTRKLLEAAKKLIQEKGCYAITMQDIIEKSGLSKGSIFHYVKSKDAIFAWVLQERLEETHNRFMNEVDQMKTFKGPMQHIANSLPALEDPEDETNKVFLHLLGKKGDPAVEEVTMKFYEHTLQLSMRWISIGQQHGVIS